MKHFHFYFVTLIMVLSSCSNDLDLVDPIDPIPVVYFQMNPDDSVYYLTLTKTFQGNNSAFDLAHDTDLVFYDSADIRLEAWTDSFKILETRFNRSDRAKLPGIFPDVPGYCYEAVNNVPEFTNQTINSYRLVINAPGMENPVVSRIPVLKAIKVPNRFNHLFDLYPDGYKYPPKSNSLGELKNGNIYEEVSKIEYQQLLCVFHYQEYAGTWIDHSATFTLRKNTLIVEPVLYADYFFNKVAANIKPISDTITRKFISLDLVFLSGDKYYKDYINTYEHDGNQDIPLKSNIINGYGLFTMIREAKYEDLILSQQTLDSLAFGKITKKLRFVRW
ncbi:MAG: hypothetical protein PHY99_07130 [Bacteroidales bacterium]|nr:hypothetical protein [Bacteroidales bacterium]